MSQITALRAGAGRKISWADLLSLSAAKDTGASLQVVFHHLQAEAAAAAAIPGKSTPSSGLVGLSQAISSALSSQGNPGRIILGASALLMGLELNLPDDVRGALSSDTILKQLSGALTVRWPLVAAVAVRCVCALARQISKGDRHDKQAWLRKVVPSLRSVLETHSRAVQVQEAFAEGCCALLLSEQISLGGQVGVLWDLLWPLAVHPSEKVAHAASLSLCRLSWLVKPPSQGETEVRPQAGQPQAKGVEDAIEDACAAFREVFGTVLPGGNLDARAGSPTMAQGQCSRLLEFLQSLVLYGKSTGVHVSGSRGKRGDSLHSDESMTILPTGRILSIVDTVLSALLRNSIVAHKVLSATSDTSQGSLTGIFVRAMDLVSCLVDVGPGALLVHASLFRRWLDQLTHFSPDKYRCHIKPTCALVTGLVRRAPAILLHGSLLAKLCRYAIAAMQPMTTLMHAQTLPAGQAEDTIRTASKSKSSQAALPGYSVQSASEIFSSACQMLAQLVLVGAPLLGGQLVASICELVVRVLWFGLGETVAQAPRVSLEAITAPSDSAACQQVCKDASSVLALLDLVEALNKPPRLGVKPLAPSLVFAFSALLQMLRQAFQRRSAHLAGTKSSSNALGDNTVQLRVVHVLDAVLAAAGRLRGGIFVEASKPCLSIQWPAPLAGTATAAEGVAGSPETCLSMPSPRHAQEMATTDTQHGEGHTVHGVKRTGDDVETLQSEEDGGFHAKHRRQDAQVSADAADDESGGAEDEDGEEELHAGVPTAMRTTEPTAESKPQSDASLPCNQTSLPEAAPSPTQGGTSPSKEAVRSANTSPTEDSTIADGAASVEAVKATSAFSQPAGSESRSAALPAAVLAGNAATTDDTKSSPKKAEAQVGSASQASLSAAAPHSSAEVNDHQGESLELFPDDDDASPLPDLCMDSPSSDEK
eukprot:TRINITY_DN9052_c0_g3_i1.p1 TRINITY_DN9052_c0_g3~~TRINITY_DN9052_c0_g3_i1.p1  ORF type:complete len:934 (+),score=167.80 TRINITY_DN9052_c0_g3_i1:42-2843(+)